MSANESAGSSVCFDTVDFGEGVRQPDELQSNEMVRTEK